MRVDHIGYAVKSIDKAKKSMGALGFQFGESVEDTDRNIYIIFGEFDGYKVELVAPRGKGSPIDAHLSKVGAGPYHLCYRSDDIESDIERLKAGSFKVFVPPAPAIAFNNRRVAFLYSLSSGLIEIVED